MQLLFVGAHPDDIEIACGGTVVRCVRAGYDTHILVLTAEASPALDTERRDETRMAFQLAGLSEDRVHFLGERDGYLSANRDTVEKLRLFLQQCNLNPDVIFVHTREDSHNDHTEANKLLCAAVRGKVFLRYKVINSGSASHFAPDFHVNISETRTTKIRMLKCHASQDVRHRLRWQEMDEADTRYSLDLGNQFVEAFELWIQEGAQDCVQCLSELNDDKFGQLSRLPFGSTTRDNYQNAWAALRMIRETIETLGPRGVLPSRDTVLIEHGPEPIHEGLAISEALRELLTQA
jgi:LmbE family N-acetylglucosaminyl deacetylase